MSNIDVVIMAAGKGTRMHSSMPKVLHRLGGRALLQHVIATAGQIQARRVLVITGHGAEQVEAALATQSKVATVRQIPQLGTGHAMQQAVPWLADDGVTLVLSGDVPLIQSETLQALLALCAGNALALLSLNTPQPSGYGRIVRNPKQEVIAIVEDRDASAEQKRIAEIYSGIMAVPTRLLRGWLTRLERLADPSRLDVRGELVCGSDIDIDINCVFEGKVQLGDGVRIGSHCVIANAVIGAGTQILPFTHIDGEDQAIHIGQAARIGPFARLRPGTQLGDEVHIGNFVEVKNSQLAKGAKANHLAYVGDATLGERVNYGAGVITANYDGANKHHTTIHADVHVGSNSVLVAPVTLGAGGTVGAGSVVTKDTAAGALTVARGKQIQVANWQRPTKKSK